MNGNVYHEINSCMNELYRISNELEEAARNVNDSIKGMNTARYINTLEACAKKYRAAADRLGRIR